MPNTLKTATGYTLLELMLTIAIIALLCSMMTVRFEGIINRYRDRYSLEHARNIVYFARASAIATSTSLKLCTGDNDGCDSNKSNLLIWRDQNDDNFVNSDEQISKLLSMSNFRIKLNRSFFRFKPDGQIWPNGSIIFCSINALSPAAKITLLYTGKISYFLDENNAVLC